MSVDQKAVMMTATQKYLIPHRALGRGRRRSRSSSSRRALLRCWRGLGCDCLWFLRGFPTTSTKANLLGKPGSAFRIAGRDHRMLSGEVLAGSILLHGQSMAGVEMSPEHSRTPSKRHNRDERIAGSAPLVSAQSRFRRSVFRVRRAPDVRWRSGSRVDRTRFGFAEHKLRRYW